MLRVINAGLGTSVQDYPGRTQYRDFGVSPAGPLDSISFCLANWLVENSDTAAGLEIQFIGPEIEFQRAAVFSVTGADNSPMLNAGGISMWSSHLAHPGDILSFGFAMAGARTYLAFAGGIEVEQIMGSRATHVPTKLGGFEGRTLTKGDIVKVGKASISPGDFSPRTLREEQIPEFSNNWEVEVMRGPYDDYLSGEDIEKFLSTTWIVSAKSDRIGYRLEGPGFEFSKKAFHKPAANGGDPSNLIDYGCPIGAINICGQTPVVLLQDGPSSTGYISPFTVIRSALRKVGQARPGDTIRFREVSMEEAKDLNDTGAQVLRDCHT